MNQFRIILTCFLIIALIVSPVIATEQVPAMPHVFFGTVYAGDQAVPAGVVVEATGTGVHTGVKGNPVTTKTDGTYGGPGSYDQKLIVQGEISDGVQISFYVNGGKAQCRVSGTSGTWVDTYPFMSSEQTNLDMKVAVLPNGTTTIPQTTEAATTTITPTPTSMPYSGGGGGGGGGSFAGSIVSGSTSTSVTTGITTAATTAQFPGGNVVSISSPITNLVTKVPVTGSPTEQPVAENYNNAQTPATSSSSLFKTIAGVFVITAIIAGIVVIVAL